MAEYPVGFYVVPVHLDTETGTITFQDLPANVPPGIQMIVFDLRRPSEAEFAGSPIGWLGMGGSAEAQLDLFQVNRFNARRFTLVIYNSVIEAVDNEVRFYVAVVYQGRIYTSDPTIILDPPGVPPY